AALEMLAIEKGLLSPEELASGMLRSTGGATEPPLPPEAVRQGVAQGAPCRPPTGRLTPPLAPAGRVRAQNCHPVGHTPLPRYARGRVGVIDRVHGTFVYPDTNAHGEGEQPQPVYCVRFDAVELWGPHAPRKDSVRLDLWEDYLEPA